LIFWVTVQDLAKLLLFDPDSIGRELFSDKLLSASRRIEEYFRCQLVNGYYSGY